MIACKEVGENTFFDKYYKKRRARAPAFADILETSDLLSGAKGQRFNQRLLCAEKFRRQPSRVPG
jgi:hypothetical protein